MSSDSWRCLIIFCNRLRISSSPSAGLPRPRASMSRSLSAALTKRSVEVRRLSCDFIASFRLALISSRSTAMAFRKEDYPSRQKAGSGAATSRLYMADRQPASGWAEPKPTALLVLADGTVLEGFGLGATGQAVGEVCFNTAMTGYEEILTDPSYAGQIITFTFPHIGNVGTNDEDIETVNLAATPGARGVVLHSAITQPSNYRATKHLDAWLKNRGVIGLAGIDTRALTALIREKGMPNAVIAYEPSGRFDIEALKREAKAWPGLLGMDLVPMVTTGQRFTWNETPWLWGEGYGQRDAVKYHVVAIDYGIKRNILRQLAGHACDVTVVPATASADEILALN